MKLFTERITVYGLFDTKSVCLYVGATATPKMRECQLRRTKGLSGKRWKFRPLLKCSAVTATRKELEQIIHYKSKGQARLNRNFVGRPAHRATTGTAVCCRMLNLNFLTMQAAANYFGCGSYVISRAVWHNGGKLPNWLVDLPTVLEVVPELCWQPKEAA